ncbi:MAG: SpoIIE family protein phosphatase [Candidatus Cloacimonetes bacterium]|nr:SpoIIE family protein phosphatase [Candidatus Cloacimonadota bacterium]
MLKPNIFFEIASSQINKFGEELCGDSIVSSQNSTDSTVILSDGLGSGVKANILATLTSRIISVMLKKGCELDDVVETLIETLPTCSYRKLAYSTFSVAKFYQSGQVHLFEYDNPPAIVIKKNKLFPVEYEIHEICGKKINEAILNAEIGDWYIFMSDGEVHAGIGGVWDLGWSWERIAAFVETYVKKEKSAKDLAFELTDVATLLYDKKHGDDTSVAVVKVREKRTVKVMIGAPANSDLDRFVVDRFMKDKTRKIVCGGTTSNIIGRILKKEVHVIIESIKPGIPPIGKIEGIDLVTEGIITISMLLKQLKENSIRDKSSGTGGDGVSLLMKEFLGADEITMMVGQAINPAHQNPGIPQEFGLKTKITEDIAKTLNKMGKQVILEYY